MVRNGFPTRVILGRQYLRLAVLAGIKAGCHKAYIDAATALQRGTHIEFTSSICREIACHEL